MHFAALGLTRLLPLLACRSLSMLTSRAAGSSPHTLLPRENPSRRRRVRTSPRLWPLCSGAQGACCWCAGGMGLRCRDSGGLIIINHAGAQLGGS
jgi:hypothetical protein